MRADLLQGRTHPTPPLTTLPLKGLEPKVLLQQIMHKARGDAEVRPLSRARAAACPAWVAHRWGVRTQLRPPVYAVGA